MKYSLSPPCLSPFFSTLCSFGHLLILLMNTFTILQCLEKSHCKCFFFAFFKPGAKNIMCFCFGNVMKKSFWKIRMVQLRWDGSIFLETRCYRTRWSSIFSNKHVTYNLMNTFQRKIIFSVDNRWYQSQAYRDTLRRTWWLKWFNQQDFLQCTKPILGSKIYHLQIIQPHFQTLLHGELNATCFICHL